MYSKSQGTRLGSARLATAPPGRLFVPGPERWVCEPEPEPGLSSTVKQGTIRTIHELGMQTTVKSQDKPQITTKNPTILLLNNCPKPYLTVVKTEQKLPYASTVWFSVPRPNDPRDPFTGTLRRAHPYLGQLGYLGVRVPPGQKKKFGKKKQSHPDAKSLHMASQITGRGVPARNRDRHAKLTSGPENWDQPATKPLRATHRLGSTSRPLHTAGERRTFPQQPLRDPAPPVPAFKLRPSLLHRDAKCFQPCAVGGNRHFLVGFPALIL